MTMLACNAVLGLGDYEKVDCQKDACDGGDAAVSEAAADAAQETSSFPDVEAGSYDPKRAWASWPMPNPIEDGGPPNPPDSSVTDAGTVVDNVTKLEWENNGANAPSKMSVAEAQSYCATLGASRYGGHIDWRLPTRIELVTLIDYTRDAGAMIDRAFAGAPADFYWTASPVSGGDTWMIDFVSGDVTTQTRPSGRVRCVRAGAPR